MAFAAGALSPSAGSVVISSSASVPASISGPCSSAGDSAIVGCVS